jgi:tetratricopeptide (TPR) repeat protein
MLTSCRVLSQELDITSALQSIESGNIQKAESELQSLKMKNPNDPSVIFLDAVITSNGEEAQKKYSAVFEKYPKSKYADAALYRIFSYYYSLGFYKKAESYLNKLKSSYPNSPYIKTADRNIPDEEEQIALIKPEQKSESFVTQFKFTIQAGAFLNLENAMKLIDQIKSDGYFAEITTKEIGGSILNIVNVGQFISEDETKSTLAYLQQKFNLKGRVISFNK